MQVESDLLKKAVSLDVGGKHLEAIAAFSLLVLLESENSVQLEHFRQRLNVLICSLDQQPDFSCPNASLSFCEEVVSEGLLQVFDAGTRKLVCVGLLGFMTELKPPKRKENHFSFADDFAVAFDEFAPASFADLFKPPMTAVVLTESSRVVKELSRSEEQFFFLYLFLFVPLQLVCSILF